MLHKVRIYNINPAKTQTGLKPLQFCKKPALCFVSGFTIINTGVVFGRNVSKTSKNTHTQKKNVGFTKNG